MVASFVLNIIEEPFISVQDLKLKSEETVNLDVTASPPSETADRGILCPLSNSPNDMTMRTTGEPTKEPSQSVRVLNPDVMTSALLKRLLSLICANSRYRAGIGR